MIKITVNHMECLTLDEYINHHFDGSRVDFSRSIGKPKQRVNEMLNQGYIVCGGAVYSKRFDLPDNDG